MTTQVTGPATTLNTVLPQTLPNQTIIGALGGGFIPGAITQTTASPKPSSAPVGTVLFETDTAKYFVFDGSSWIEAEPRYQLVSLQTDYTPADTSIVSTGLGVTLHPLIDKMKILCIGHFKFMAAGTMVLMVYRSTVGVPLQGTGVGADTLVGRKTVQGTIPMTVSASLNMADSGLTPGQAYWWYIAVAKTIGTVTLVADINATTLRVEQPF